MLLKFVVVLFTFAASEVGLEVDREQVSVDIAPCCVDSTSISTMSLKRSAGTMADSTPDERQRNNNYSVSEAVLDRKSRFAGYYSPSLPARTLQSLPELKPATHRIAAWRVASKQTTLKTSSGPLQLFDVGHDDDGESWAGKRLEKVLEEMGVTGSIVVARWYGGVLLGPVRFQHIETVARNAVRRWQQTWERDGEGDRKRRQVDSASRLEQGDKIVPRDPELEEKERRALVKELQSRDESIVVLRQLLDQKKADTVTAGSPLAASQSSEPTKPLQASPSATSPEYESFPLARLQQLEKARDASIGFLLKQIDKTEAQQGSRK
ncbi:ribosomal protein S5 domain 2-like protein [Eremomyces bilateralis CBS 781.70]|uniref:Ribosomal protein S5 domain 2-like protein n=1 Tax=Eremomyces bilateralis CBS 781.70 TaxID=1392243 RepID=A0A6G1G8Z6_9PEZI|nr:ribosomal protein S5 domain 2-like protein [Eremomyces bilateralis CBS 781.70]KAF1814381.1 ribosomal protein S5 domain 2-like protein [Eremomyces bilateralis CBS 781.70]